MSKYPCGLCGRGVRSRAVLCNGACNLWFHTKCLNMSDVEFRKLFKDKNNMWKCGKCEENTIYSLNQNICLDNITEKILNITNNTELDVNESLSVAAEAGTLLLQENDNLKQQVYELRNKLREYETDTEYKITDLEGKIVILLEEKVKAEDEYSCKIESMHKELQKELDSKNNLIFQLEDDYLKCKTQLKEHVQQINSLKSHIADLNGQKLNFEEIIKQLRNKSVKVATNHTKLTKEAEINTSDRDLICMEILESSWITDDAIQTYYDALTSKVLKNDILLMNPVIVQAIKCLEDINHFIEPLELANKSFIFLPINDSAMVDQVGGSHWSLMLYVRGLDKFFYLDSSADYNLRHAQQVKNKIAKYLGLSEFAPLHKIDVPQQTNTVDCGVYMLLFTDVLIQLVIQGKIGQIGEHFKNACPYIKTSDVLTKRAQLALFLRNNNHTKLNADTLKSMMFSLCCDPVVLPELSTNSSNGPSVGFQQTIKPHMLNDQRCFELYSRKHQQKILEQNSSFNNNFHIPVSNRFAVLETEQMGLNDIVQESSTHQQINDQKSTRKRKTRNNNKMSVKINTKNKKLDHQIVNTRKKKKVHLYSDSHGKELGLLLVSLLPNNVETFVNSSSGATIEHILEKTSNVLINFTKEDNLIIIAGANNFCEANIADQNPAKRIVDLLHRFSTINSHTNIIYVTQFHRYDMAWDNIVNKEIHKLNCELNHLENLRIIDTSDFKRQFFTVHGQHLNRIGKRVLSRRIADLVLTPGLREDIKTSASTTTTLVSEISTTPRSSQRISSPINGSGVSSEAWDHQVDCVSLDDKLSFDTSPSLDCIIDANVVDDPCSSNASIFLESTLPT